MYSPRPFDISDFDIIEAFISQNSFATLISAGEKYPMATHIPLYMEKRQDGHYLIGHAARANEQIRKLVDSTLVTVIFQGPHGYISSYAKDPTGMSILPTWDYQIVEIRGSLNFVDDDQLRAFLVGLLKRHEQQEPKRMNLDEYPQDVLRKKMKAILGFEIKINEAVGCFRLNQNRTETERRDIINRLKENPSSQRLIAEIEKFNN